MFLPFDQPSAGKITLHRRSKTISVLKNKQKSKGLSPTTKKFTHGKSYNSVSVLKNYETLVIKDRDSSRKYQSLQSMTEQIQRLINREMCYTQLLTYVEKHSSRTKTLESQNHQNPEGYEFNDTFYAEKNKKNIQNCSNGFRQPEYFKLLKKTQKLNSKGFVPHFNWKEKLNRMKNVGNYGHVYKKNDKPTQKKELPKKEPPKKENPPEFKDYIIDSTKITIDPQIIISRGLGFEEAKLHRKMSACKRCLTSFSEYSNEVGKRHHRTLTAGQRLLHSRKSSQLKPVVQHKSSRKEKNPDREWKFEPWDINKDS